MTDLDHREGAHMHARLVITTRPPVADVLADPRYHAYARGQIAMAKAVAKITAEQIDQLTTDDIRSELREIVMHLEQVVPDHMPVSHP